MEGQGDGGAVGWRGGGDGGSVGMEGRRDGEAVVVIDHVLPRSSSIVADIYKRTVRYWVESYLRLPVLPNGK